MSKFSSDSDSVSKLELGSAYPTLEHNQQARLASPLERTTNFERTNSISILNGPARVDPRKKLPVNFRTLSIHVTETQHGRPHSGRSKAHVADIATLEWHSLSVDEVLVRQGVSPNAGLDTAMAARRLSSNGANQLSPTPKHWLRRVFFYFFGGFGSLLCVAGTIAIIAWKPLGNPAPQVANLALGIVLYIVLLLQAFFNAWQDYSTGRTMASITDLLPTEVPVKRDGQQIKVPAAQLVVGDLVEIVAGTKVPADVRIIRCNDVKFDRSVLTGESIPVSGTVDMTDPNFMESRNIALQGSLCTAGSATGCVIACGDSTVLGRIAKQATAERPQRTTLETEINRFVLIIAAMAASTTLLVVILWSAWLRRDHPDFINVPTLLIDCISVLVAFIPEGLPICVTLSLTVIAGQMKQQKVLAKSLSTVESLGCVSVICSDKTGTLTQNRMTVVNGSLGVHASTAADLISSSLKDRLSPASLLVACAALCNDAKVVSEERTLPAELLTIHGDATDTGLLRFAAKTGSVDKPRSAWVEEAQVAFNSKNKFAIKLFRAKDVASAPVRESDSFDSIHDRLLLVKGAPDILLKRCSAIIDQTGDSVALTDDAKAVLTATQISFAGQGQRVLLLARKIVPLTDFDKETIKESDQRLEEELMEMNDNLTIVGLLALVDPPREDSRWTVEAARRAGIRFMMVTGDFALTAQAIATQCGIITNAPWQVHGLADLDRDFAVERVKPFDWDKDDMGPKTSLVLSGSELMTMNESQWAQAIAYDEVVFARTTPQQKLQIVRAYQSSSAIVAVTGDGTNDAPALKQANVGVAVRGGSDVALEAADLVLLEKFSAIIVGIESGRRCFENLKKTILYLLPAGSFSELIPVLLNIFFGLPQVLSSIQMIIICAATDVFPALSLVYEKPEADLLTSKPRRPSKDRLANGKLIAHAYFFIGLLESLTSCAGAFYFGFQRRGIRFSQLWLQYGGYNVDPDLLAEATAHAQSIYFFNLVIMQWFNLLSTRTRKRSLFQQNPLTKPSRNLRLFAAMAIALLIAIFFSYIPWFQRILGTATIGVEYYFLPMAYGCFVLLCDEGRKFFVRNNPGGLLDRMAW